MSPQQALTLQRLAGNTAVVQRLQDERETLASTSAPSSTSCASHGPAATTVQRSAVHEVLAGAGRPLDADTRADMETRLGADFSDVRLHTGPTAQRSADEIGARAYTSGSHIVLGAGAGDRHTLAHELTHVIQQRRGPVAGTDHGDGLSVSDPSDRFEREAEANAGRALSLPAEHAAPAPAGPEGHAGHSHGHTAAGSAVVAQRMWNGRGTTSRSRRAGANDVGAQLARQQREQMEYLPALYIPAETFGRDGSLPPQPTLAYATPSANDVEILRMEDSLLPSVPHRDPAPRTAWPMKYQSGDFIYRVEMVNDPHAQTSDLLIDTAQPFRILRRTLKMRQGGASAGRTYRFAERWAPNPQYWNLRDPQDAADAAAQAADRGLPAEERLSPYDVAGFSPLPTDADQPFVFYVSPNTVDPHFQRRDGTQKNERRYLSAERFDGTVAAGAAVTGYDQQAFQGLSSPHQVDRRTGRRDPARAMGNQQANQLMGNEGRGGSTGERLASHEWCHLVGDGDGGPDRPENLVIGTNAVNTEQLAMETALRPFVGRLRTMGYSIQLRVRALVTPVDDPALPGGRCNVAQYISYRISLVPHGELNAANPWEIHRQIMDGQRGTITELEFTYLHHTVRARLRRAIEDIEAQDDDDRMSDGPGGPQVHQAAYGAPYAAPYGYAPALQPAMPGAGAGYYQY
ncbi:DUF4157 domain-containing protein [Streptomyces sp. IBSBF 2807]|nr:DUF4157 domain-containing protein [Streptomyces hilarionis]MCQ9133798.1 DUF4157 domain-containing protein [Streptomyces hilarionis]